MTIERPRIVATLAARSATEAAREVARAQADGADLAEIRLDRWAADDRGRLGELFPSPLPLLLTFRSRAEGGEGTDDPTERAAILTAATRLPFEAVDLEAVRDLGLLSSEPVRSVPVHVVSSHLTPDTPASEIGGLLRATPENGSIRKVVIAASIGRAIREFLPAVPPADEASRVLLTTGPSGALFRAWSYRLGFPLVFARVADRRGPDGSVRNAVEPSQIPVDRMRAFFDGGPSAPLFGVVGRPVAHSQSPYLHARWMRESGSPGLYVPLEVESESEFVDALPALAARGFRGLNVTHPWKSVALAAASRVERAAEVCAAANCLTLRGDEVEADNTDLAAILRRLEEFRTDGRWDGRELAVVGAGGSAAATLAAARELGASAFVLARDPDRAAEIAGRFGATALAPGAGRAYDLVVHATPVGRDDAGPLEVPVGPLLRAGGTLLDWVYSPSRSDLRDLAVAASATYEDGWTLLVYQAAASYAIWWGTEPTADQVTATIQEGPCEA